MLFAPILKCFLNDSFLSLPACNSDINKKHTQPSRIGSKVITFQSSSQDSSTAFGNRIPVNLLSHVWLYEDKCFASVID